MRSSVDRSRDFSPLRQSQLFQDSFKPKLVKIEDQASQERRLQNDQNDYERHKSPYYNPMRDS